jgi:hypothetical protein
MKSVFTALLLSLLSTQSFAQSQPTENLSSLMGAINQVVSDKTQVGNTKEKDTKMTPPAQAVYHDLQGDLELCQTTKSQAPEIVNVEKDGVKVEFKKFDLTISGEKCPINIEMSIKSTEQTVDSFNADFSMKIVFKSDNYIQKYKMKHIQATGVISAKAEKVGDVVRIPARFRIATEGESTELGAIAQSIDFDITLEANLVQFNFTALMEQKSNIQYSGKNQTGYSRSKMSGFTAPEVYFSIDDKEVSASEYKTFTQSFMIPGLVSNDSDGSPDAKTTTSCSFVAYDKKFISAADLKVKMQKSELPTEGQLVIGNSCSKDLSIPFKQADQDLSGKLSFGAEWISFGSATKTDTEALSSSVYVIYGDASVQTRETESLVIGLQCQAVTACP